MENNYELENLRKKIDGIDNSLISLLKERFDTVNEIARYKKEHGIQIFQPEREKIILENLKIKAEDKNINPEFITEIFQKIMDESKTLQEKHLSPIRN